MSMIHTSTSYDYSGRRRKAKKVKGEVYAKYKKPAFQEYKPKTSYAQERAAEVHKYPSLSVSATTKGGGTRKERLEYTGDFVIGIATMHKSNAVPVTNPKYAEEISRMSK